MANLGSFGRATPPLLLALIAEILATPAARAEPAAATARATAAPLEASLVIAAPALVAAMTSRLAGHRFVAGDHALVVEDIAGEGRPWVGVVSARCGALWLDTAVRSLRLTGPLARPRLAGPGYLMWATGAISNEGSNAASNAALELRRLGILARPDEVPRDRPPPAAGIPPCSPP